MVTGHGARSITGVEVGMDIETMSQKQLEAIPGIGEKTAWKLISQRAKRRSKGKTPFETAQSWFNETSVDWSEAYSVFFDP